MVANRTWAHWYRDWRSPVLAAVFWILFARYLFGETNPLAIEGILDLVAVPDIVKIWLLAAGPYWAVIGAWQTRSRYRQRLLDDSSALSVGSLAGFAAGPFLLIPLWLYTPDLNKSWIMPVLSFIGLGEIYWAFVTIFPNNLCSTSATYLMNQFANGISIGLIFALMAIGLTLIYSIQGIVSFTHGQIYMLGGYLSYGTVGTLLGGDVNPIVGIIAAGLMIMVIGSVFERIFLQPMHTGLIERASEYAILITFGFGFLIEYTVLATVGAKPYRLNAYVSDNTVEFLGLTLLANRAVAGVVAVVLIFGLLIFIQYTWWGRALRAVSMDKQAAAVVGINPNTVNTLTFGLGKMLAGMAGAALVPILAFTPAVGAPAAGRSYVIVVLGGLGSIPGALLGGLIIGLMETLGVGCYPNITRGLAYQDAYGLVIFAIMLLIRPTGLLGRKLE